MTTTEMTAASGYIYLAAVGCPTLKIAVESGDMAAGQMLGYCRRYNLGVSALKRGCGDIRTKDGVTIARVSYNGRVWTTDGEMLQDIHGGLPIPA